MQVPYYQYIYSFFLQKNATFPFVSALSEFSYVTSKTATSHNGCDRICLYSSNGSTFRQPMDHYEIKNHL